MEYEEGGGVLRKITAAMDEINGRALADVQGSLRAYVFTPEVGRRFTPLATAKIYDANFKLVASIRESRIGGGGIRSASKMYWFTLAI